MSHDSLDDLKIVRKKRLAELLDVSPVTLWRMRQRGEIPPPIQISKGIEGWRHSTIANLLETRSSR